MHYYYDCLANLDECLWEFYEWENTDHLTPIKKVPLIRVSNNDLKNLMLYNVTFPVNWLENYIGKTSLKNSKEKPLLILFSSTKNTILLELSKEGDSLYRSKLLIEDEINCNEFAYSLKESKIVYEKKDALPLKNEFRRALEEKRLLKMEIKTMKEKEDIEKCSYLYFEWFGSLENDFLTMIHQMEQELTKPYNMNLHKITELIKLSYKEQL